MDYGQRLARAMKHGGFTTDQALADAMTMLLRKHGRIGSTDLFNYKTVQSARTRITKDSFSKFTLDFAHLCRVDPHWLAFGVGTMELAEPKAADDVRLARLMRIWAGLDDRQCAALVKHAEWIKDDRETESPPQKTHAPRKKKTAANSSIDATERRSAKTAKNS